MATLQKFKNNATTTLAAGIDAVQTSIDVADATALPTITGSEWFYLTITQPTGTTETAWEIVKVTAVAVNTLTVERGQNGTSAQAWSSGSKAENRIVQADAAAFASPYRLSSPDDRSYIEIYDDYTLWSIQDVTVFYSNGVSSTQFYCPGATALTSTGALSIYAASGGLAFQTNVGGDIGFTAGYDPGALPSGVLRMAGQKVEFRGQTMDLIPPFTIGGEPPIQLRFYRAFSSFTSVGFSASMTTDPAADVVWQLPGGDGTANQAMVTDGAGLLSWRTVLSTPAAANMVLTADGLGTFTAATSAELEDGYLTLSGAIGPGIYINGTGSLGGGEIYLSDDGSGSFTGTLTASNLSGTNTGDQDLSGLQPLDAQLTALAGLSYASNGGKFIRVNGTEDGFELASVAVPSAADPTATIGLTATNGVAATFMRSDAAPALSQSIAPTWTGVHTFQQAVAATSTDGIVLATSATATSGNQKWSPALHFTGSGWKTPATAGAQSVDWKIEVKPTQSGDSTALSALCFSSSVNGGAYTERVAFMTPYTAGALAGVILDGLLIDTRTYRLSDFQVSFGTGSSGSYTGGATSFWWNRADGFSVNSGFTLAGYGFSTGPGSVPHTGVTYGGSTGNIRLGYAAANPPVAQTLSVQDASGTDIAGATWTFRASRGTGAGAVTGKAFSWQTPDVGSTGTTLQTATEKWYMNSTGELVNTLPVAATSTDGVVLATSATATSGNQKYSPRLRFRGSYFSGSAKTTDWSLDNEPTSSGGVLAFAHSDNGGAYSTVVSFSAAGYATAVGFRQSSGYNASNPQYADSTGAAGMSCSTNGAFFVASSTCYVAFNSTGLVVNGASQLGFTSGAADAAGNDAFFMRSAAASIRLGAAAANPPVAQTLSVQDASGTDVAGAAFLIRGSRGTGVGAPGTIGFQVGVPGASGTTLQTAETQLTIGYHTATWVDALNFVFGSTTGTKIGTSTTQKIGFFNATPVVQPSAITAPAGGATVDAEARTAISSLISALQTLGLTA